MPPKSQIASLIGQANRTFENRAELLFDWYRESMSNLTTTTFDELKSSTTDTIAKPDSEVQLSVKVAPEVPILRKSTGNSIQIKQLWEGTVLCIRGNSVEAVLTDKTQSQSPAEQIEFDISELRPDDLPLVAPGSVFYWMLGKELTPAGQVRGVSAIEFSRLPLWTRGSLAAAAEKVSATEQWFLADEENPALTNAKYPATT